MIIIIREKADFDFEVIKETLVVERYEDVKVDRYLERMCFYYGKTLRGNRAIVRKCLKVRQLVPVSVSEEWIYILFPVVDRCLKQRIWLNYGRIKTYEQAIDTCVVTFANGYRISLNIARRTFQMQMDRCFFLLYMQYCFLYRITKKPSDIGELGNISNLLFDS